MVRSPQLTLSVLFAAILAGCAPTHFTGKADQKTSPVVPATSGPQSPPATKPDAPQVTDTTKTEVPATPAIPKIPGVPTECSNTIATTGVHDDASGHTFRLITTPLSYDDGLAACAAAGASGKLIFASQELPDAVLACKQALGVLWLSPTEGEALWSPVVTGEEDPAAKHWIICYY